MSDWVMRLILDYYIYYILIAYFCYYCLLTYPTYGLAIYLDLRTGLFGGLCGALSAYDYYIYYLLSSLELLCFMFAD